MADGEGTPNHQNRFGRLLPPLGDAALRAVMTYGVYEAIEQSSEALGESSLPPGYAVLIAAGTVSLGATGLKWLRRYKSPFDGEF
jgi:hypothetical protein